MAEAIIKLTLDTFRENRVQEPVVVQDDYDSRFIDATITTLGKREEIPAAAAVLINASRMDGEAKSFSGKVNPDGTVRVPITQWMTELDDRVTYNISVVTDKKLSTTPSTFLVKHSPNRAGTPEEGTPEADLLAEVLANENARQAAEATRAANENERKTAEEARQSEETQRLTDEATRSANEAERVSAEASRDTTFKSWANDIALLPDMSARISRNSKQIEGLLQRIKPSPFVFDETVAYQKDVPSNAVGAAEIHKIGGMTRKCANLFDLSLIVNSSGTVKRDGDTVTITGYIAMAHFKNLTVGKTYCFSAKSTRTSERGGGVSIEFLDDSGATVGSGIYDTNTTNPSKKFTIPSGTARVRFYLYGTGGSTDAGSATYSNLMLNEGDAQPYEPYFEGLRSAKVTEIKSVGANLTKAQAVYEGANSYNEMVVDGRNCIRMTSGATSKNSPIKFKENTQYTVSFYTKSENYNGATIQNNAFTFWYADGTDSSVIYPQNASEWGKVTLTSVAGKTVVAVGVMAREYRAYNYIDIDTFMLNKGSTDLPCVPYVEHTMPIPESVRPANGINSEVYDSIEWGEDGKQRKRVKCGVVVFDGTERWERIGDSYFVLYSDYSGLYAKSGIGICSHFEYNMDTFFIGEAGIAIFKNELSSVDEFKAYLAEQHANGTPVTIVYELAEPIVTDISDLITSDNLLPIEGGGTITFENEYGYDVPSTVEYITAESDE